MNKTHTIIKYGIFLIFQFFICQIGAQDIQFAQFYNATSLLNPALTGIHAADQEYSFFYNNRWANVPIGFWTFSGQYSHKFLRPDTKKSFWAGGLAFNYDRAGRSGLSLGNLGVNGTFVHQLNQSVLLSAGLQAGINQRAFKTNELTFDSQFDGDSFRADLPVENFDRTTFYYMDFAGGFNWHIQNFGKHRTRNKLDIGAAIFHFNQPLQQFQSEGGVRLPARWSSYILSAWAIHPKMDLLAHVSIQLQNPSRAYTSGGALKYYLSQVRSKTVALQVGATYQFHERGAFLIPNFELSYYFWKIGLAYTLNVSQVATGLGRNNGPELFFRYAIFKIRPPEKMNICRIF